MIKRYLFFLLGVTIFSFVHAQNDSTDWQPAFDKAKKEIKELAGQGANEYAQVGRKLEALAIKNPGYAEPWYFLGAAIDKFNTSSGEDIPTSSLSLAEKASQCFSSCLALSNNNYKGDVLLLDPHSKILSVWGAQAYRFLNEQKTDSAIWCLQQANKYGAINATVKDYFKQVLDECSHGAYLFTNGDLYFYYLAYLQLVENYRHDVHCISLNFLNTKWYPEFLSKDSMLPLVKDGVELAKIKDKKWKAREVSIQNKSNVSGDSLISWTLKPTNGEYLLRADIILQKFIEYNAFQKDIFFAADVPQNMRLFLNEGNYLQLRGLTLKLVPKTNASSLSFLENRLAELNELSVDDTSFLCSRDNIQVLNNYRFAYVEVASLAIREKRLTSAKNIMLFERQKYPESLLPFFAEATKKWFQDFMQKNLNSPENK
ncbi:hypothetical protein [Arachidicoccus sp.]|uniref:hypothetical protein n=1 Tax=Arachidicoccus sp. TaxID=1872624 RepID=UPI003D22E6F7